MNKNKPHANPAPSNGGNVRDQKAAPINPWTETFILLAKYLIKDYEGKVKLTPQFELFQKPMRIDAVIIIQEKGLVIDNALMRSFKRHNIIEFKSPNDTLTIQAFDKTISYFYAYLSNERMTENPPIEFDDVTLTIVSVRKPVKTLKMLREKRKYKIVNTETPGFYYITKDGGIPEKILLVISSELPDDANDQCLAWLRSLRNNLTPEEAVEAIKRAENVDDRESVWSIVNFILDVNTKILGEVKKMRKNLKLMEFYRDVAIESGVLEEFAEEKARELAKTMLVDEEPIEKIVKYTGLDVADIVLLQSAMA